MLTFSFAAYCTVEKILHMPGISQRPPGTAEQLLALLVTQGRCTVQAGDGFVLATAGDIVAGPASGHILPAENCEATALVLSGAASRDFAAALEAPVLFPASDAKGAAAQMVQLAETKKEETTAHTSARAYTLVCALAALAPQADARPGAGALPALVEAAVAQMRENFSEVYGVEELAEGLGVSKCHLIRCFSKAMGISPGRYLTRVRLEEAQSLLLHTRHSLELVAGLCGFSGANYFCRVFKKEMGASPAVWRQENRGRAGRYTAAPREELYYL